MEKLLLTVWEAADVLSVSRSHNPPNPGPQDRQLRVSAANPQDRSEATALDGGAGGPLSQLGGGRAPRPRAKPMPTAGGQEMIMTTSRIQPDVPPCCTGSMRPRWRCG